MADAGACCRAEKQDTGSFAKKDMLTVFCAKRRNFQPLSTARAIIRLTKKYCVQMCAGGFCA